MSDRIGTLYLATYKSVAKVTPTYKKDKTFFNSEADIYSIFPGRRRCNIELELREVCNEWARLS
jgi:hypothetical protein